MHSDTVYYVMRVVVAAATKHVSCNIIQYIPNQFETHHCYLCSLFCTTVFLVSCEYALRFLKLPNSGARHDCIAGWYILLLFVKKISKWHYTIFT